MGGFLGKQAFRRHARRLYLISGVGALTWIVAPLAFAQDAGSVSTPSVVALAEMVKAQDARLEAQQQALQDQARELSSEKALIDAQARQLEQMRAQQDRDLAQIRGAGPQALVTSPQAVAELSSASEPVQNVSSGESSAASPAGPVGQAPPPEKSVIAQVLPEGVNVLTPKGHFVFDNSVIYTQSSNNLLVFRGVELVPGIQVGLIEANNTADNTSVATSTLRYGLWDRVEVEAVVPYVYRSDRVTLVQQAQTNLSQTTELSGSGIGDVEGTIRYQLNRGGDGWPVFVSNLRVKSVTGSGPYDVPFDSDGVATRLNTGSGFWAVEPSVSWLYTSDPVVLFGNLGYIDSFGRNINKSIGSVPVGRVDPGGTIEVSGGFAFSVNPRFSFSLGYRHDYLFKTTSILGGTKQSSTSLVVGNFLVGAAYRLTNRLSLATSLELGVTSDAPNDEVVVRLPFVF